MKCTFISWILTNFRESSGCFSLTMQKKKNINIPIEAFIHPRKWEGNKNFTLFPCFLKMMSQKTGTWYTPLVLLFLSRVLQGLPHPFSQDLIICIVHVTWTKFLCVLFCCFEDIWLTYILFNVKLCLLFVRSCRHLKPWDMFALALFTLLEIYMGIQPCLYNWPLLWALIPITTWINCVNFINPLRTIFLNTPNFILHLEVIWFFLELSS